MGGCVTEMRCDALMYIEIFALTTYQWGRVDEHEILGCNGSDETNIIICCIENRSEGEDSSFHLHLPVIP